MHDPVEDLLSRLSSEDKDRILGNAIWNAFGDLDDDENMVLLPDRKTPVEDTKTLIEGLRQDLWPEEGEDETEA